VTALSQKQADSYQGMAPQLAEKLGHACGIVDACTIVDVCSTVEERPFRAAKAVPNQ
jgi:hypothetical protein